jgi:hypothetical protein
LKLHLPYYSEKSTITVHGEPVEVKAYQVIVWVSISDVDTQAWDSRLPRLPAILDVGHTHNFALTENQLHRWAGIHAAGLPRIGWMRKEGMRMPLHRANLWLHTDGEPYRLSLAEGFAVVEGTWPRLPILGLRALTMNKLHTFIYGDTKQVIIRTPPSWFWPF